MSESDIEQLDQAIHDTVHDYRNPNSGKKGPGALAPLIGMAASTLQNKADRKQEFAHLGLKEARSVMLATNNFRILEQFNHDLGFVAVPVPHIENPADMDLLDAHLDWTNEFGETAGAIKQALQDGTLTRDELDKIKKEFYEDFEKGQVLMQRLEGMCEPESKGNTLREVK